MLTVIITQILPECKYFGNAITHIASGETPCERVFFKETHKSYAYEKNICSKRNETHGRRRENLLKVSDRATGSATVYRLALAL